MSDEIWSAALEQLSSQMTNGTYDTHLRNSKLVGIQASMDGASEVFTVQVGSRQSADWLNNRLKKQVVASLAAIASNDVSVHFVYLKKPDYQPKDLADNFQDMPAIEAKSSTRLAGFTPILDKLGDEYSLRTAALYGIIWRYSQMDRGVCCLSAANICKLLRCSRPTFYKHLNKLIDDKLVTDVSPKAIPEKAPRWYIVSKKPTVKQSVSIEI